MTKTLLSFGHSECKRVKRKQYYHFNFCLFSPARSTLKGKNLLLYEQILSFQSRPDCQKGFVFQESKQEVTEVVSLCKKRSVPHAHAPSHYFSLVTILCETDVVQVQCSLIVVLFVEMLF